MFPPVCLNYMQYMLIVKTFHVRRKVTCDMTTTTENQAFFAMFGISSSNKFRQKKTIEYI